MKNVLTAALVLWVLPMHSISAQTANPSASAKEALPSGPLIVSKMPDFAKWTIDFSYSNAPKAGDPSVLDRYKQEALKDPELAKAMQDPQFAFTIRNIRQVHVVVTKTKDVVHEERQFEQGYQGDMWSNSEIQVEKRPNLDRLVAVINIDNNDAFPDFDWIAKRNFSGLESHGGLQCMAFKEDRYNDEHQFIGTIHAWVDVATRYPEGYEFGPEKRSYTFQDPPTGMQVIPPNYLDAAKAMADQIKKATPHLAAP